MTTSLQILWDINIALHSMRMGPAKGAEVSTNNSTLGDPAAQEPPKRNLAWDMKKQKSF